MFAFLLRGGKWWEQMEGKVLSVLEWVESLLPMQRSKEKQETGSDISILKHEIISLLNISHPATFVLGFSGGSDGKEYAPTAGDLGSILGLGRSSGGGHGNLLQYSCLDNLHGQRSLAGYSPWHWHESDTTDNKHNTFVLLYDVSCISRVIPYN